MWDKVQCVSDLKNKPKNCWISHAISPKLSGKGLSHWCQRPGCWLMSCVADRMFMLFEGWLEFKPGLQLHVVPATHWKKDPSIAIKNLRGQFSSKKRPIRERRFNRSTVLTQLGSKGSLIAVKSLPSTGKRRNISSLLSNPSAINEVSRKLTQRKISSCTISFNYALLLLFKGVH